MDEKDYSKRTSHMYDDRDGKTVTDLDGLIKVCAARDKHPSIVRFLTVTNDPEKSKASGVPETSLHIDVVEYVNIGALPEPLSGLVREILAGLDPKE